MFKSIAVSVGFLAYAAMAQSGAYGQCGGIGWSGSTSCVSGYACSIVNDYYYQCLPGQAPSTTSRPSSGTTTGATSTTRLPSTTVRPTTTGAPGGAYPTTLQSGYYWVRAVASPNFHSYLQAAPTATPSPAPGDAYLLKNTNAGQFNVIDGQLVYNAGSGRAPLYMGVENPTNKTQRTLETRFATTKNTYGTFAFQGDTLTWSTPDIARPNLAAWLVCGGTGQLYINTGAYLYQTPAGCADQTIHSYGGSTADV